MTRNKHPLIFLSPFRRVTLKLQIDDTPWRAALEALQASMRQAEIEAAAAIKSQFLGVQLSPKVAETLRRSRRCQQVRDSVLRGGDVQVVEQFLRLDLVMWRSNPDSRSALREAAEDALLTIEVEALPATVDPYAKIRGATRKGYRSRMPAWAPCLAPAGGPRHAHLARQRGVSADRGPGFPGAGVQGRGLTA